MNDKMYDEYKPVVKFYSLNNSIYFNYNNNFLYANTETIDNLKNELIYPCKITFYDLSINDIVKIINIILDSNIKLYCYRIKENNKNIYNAVFIENEKIKKIK